MDKRLILIILLALIIRIYPYQQEYYLGSDSFYHYRITKYVFENGAIPVIDDYSHAPQGSRMNYPPLLHYFTAYLYQILKFTGISLYRFCGLLPAFIGAIAIIPIFALSKLLFDERTAYLASVFYALSPAAITYATAMFFDVDPFANLLGVFSVYMLLKSLKTKRPLFSIVSGICLGLLYLTSRNFLFYYILTLVFIFLYRYSKMNIKKPELDFPAILVPCLFFIYPLSYTLLSGLMLLTLLGVTLSIYIKKPIIPLLLLIIFGILAASTFKQDWLSNLFYKSPISSSVMEYSSPNLPISLILFSSTLIGILGIFAIKWKLYDPHIILLPWFVMSLGGYIFVIKFFPLLAIPLSIFAGVFVSKSKYFLPLLAICLGVLVLTNYWHLPTLRTDVTASKIEAFNFLKDHTPKNSIIYSTWDLGYKIQTLAERRTITDNGLGPEDIRRMREFTLAFLSPETNASAVFDKYQVDYLLLIKSKLLSAEYMGLVDRPDLIYEHTGDHVVNSAGEKIYSNEVGAHHGICVARNHLCTIQEDKLYLIPDKSLLSNLIKNYTWAFENSDFIVIEV